MKSSNGGRKRGRPRVLTPEQRREKAKRRQRLHRRQKADKEWLRATNSGRIIYLHVLHWLDLLEFLVAVKVLDSKDVENTPAIEDAVEEALGLALAEMRTHREELHASYDFVSQIANVLLDLPDHNFRPTARDPGTVRFKVTHEVADILDLEIDDTHRIKERLEDHLFRLYSQEVALGKTQRFVRFVRSSRPLLLLRSPKLWGIKKLSPQRGLRLQWRS